MAYERWRQPNHDPPCESLSSAVQWSTLSPGDPATIRVMGGDQRGSPLPVEGGQTGQLQEDPVIRNTGASLTLQVSTPGPQGVLNTQRESQSVSQMLSTWSILIGPG